MALADTARLISSLELQDKFSATAAKYDRTIAGMERKTSTLSKIGGEVGRGAQNAVNNIAKIGVVAGGVIASQVVAGVKSLEQLATVVNQTEAVIKSTDGIANVTAEGVRRLSEAYETLSTVDDKVIQGGANILLTFTKVRNEVGAGNDIFSQGIDVALDMSIAMGTDLKQAAIQVGKALNDPIKGVGALRRVGVQLTEQQEKSIKKFIEQGDVMKAQKVILAELETQFGGSAEAFGKGPGADMRRFGDAIEGAQQALATGFLPLITKVSAKVQEVLGNEEVQRQIRQFGKGAAGSIDDLISVAGKLPWAAIGEAFKLMGTGAKAALDLFTSLPPWVQTAVLTGWGLNKLTGGALGGIVGELGKGLIKGVLGMTAGVVHIKAGTVVGGPPVPGGKGPGLLGPAVLGGGLLLAGIAAVKVVEFLGDTGSQADAVKEKLDTLVKNTGTDLPNINESIDRMDTALRSANETQLSTLVTTATGTQDRLREERAELITTRNELARNIVRGTDETSRRIDRTNQNMDLERAAQQAIAAADAARINGLRDSHNAALGTLAQIRDKKLQANVNVNVNSTINLSAAEVALRTYQYHTTVQGTRVE